MDNQWCPVCEECDALLNELVLDFMRIPNADELIRIYKGD